jgi:transposase
MGQDKPPQRSLFYTGINLDKRVRGEHVLRKVAKLVDFEFVYGEVKESYGYNGNVSVAPPMILKLMLLLVLYNVRSERELMATLPEGMVGSNLELVSWSSRNSVAYRERDRLTQLQT